MLRVDPWLRLASQRAPDQKARQVETGEHDQDTGEPARNGHARVVGHCSNRFGTTVQSFLEIRIGVLPGRRCSVLR